MQSRQERPESRVAVDALNGDLQRLVELLIAQALGSGQHLPDDPDVVLDDADSKSIAVTFLLPVWRRPPGGLK